MKVRFFSFVVVVLVFSINMMFIPTESDATVSPAGKAATTWAKIKAGHGSAGPVKSQASKNKVLVRAAPATYPGRVSDGVYYPLPGHPGRSCIEYIAPMAGADGGIEVKLTYSGILTGSQELGSIRLAVWVLKGYYAAGGSDRLFPNNFQYVSSIANEIKLHCDAVLGSFFWREIMWGLPRWFVDRIARSANPVNIEARDHPGYKLGRLQAIHDWTNGRF